MCKKICFTPMEALMSKDLNMSFLLDFYGDVLSEKQREAMDLFYNGDLSLAEISEEQGITRQGVRDRIVKGEQIITELESKLGLARRFGNVNKDVSYIIDRLKELSSKTGENIDDIIEVADRLRN